MLTIRGLVTGSLTTAREWETHTAKELLLSPTSRAAIITGKILASFTTTFCFGILVLYFSYLVGWIQPEGIYWFSAALVIALVSLFSSALGIAIGILIQRVQAVSPISINVGMYLFFLAGGVGVLAFEPAVLQNVASFIPLTYGRHALETAVFYSSFEQFGRDTTVLCVSILLAIGLSVLAIRREITQ